MAWRRQREREPAGVLLELAGPEPRNGGAFGFVLVDHALGGLGALPRQLVAVGRDPVVGLLARDIAAVEHRHHEAGVELVGSLGGLPVGDVVGPVQHDAELALSRLQLPDQLDGIVGRADDADLVLQPVVDDVLARRHDEVLVIQVRDRILARIDKDVALQPLLPLVQRPV